MRVTTGCCWRKDIRTGGGSGRCWVGSRYCRYRRDREVGWSSLHRESVLPEGWARRSIAKTGRKMGRFWPCRCGWQTAGSAPIEKSFRNVAIRRDWHTMVSFSRSKRKFWIVCLRLLRQKVPLTIINCTSAPPASKALTQLQKAGFRKIGPLYFVEIPALEKPFWGLIF